MEASNCVLHASGQAVFTGRVSPGTQANKNFGPVVTLTVVCLKCTSLFCLCSCVAIAIWLQSRQFAVLSSVRVGDGLVVLDGGQQAEV